MMLNVRKISGFSGIVMMELMYPDVKLAAILKSIPKNQISLCF